MTNIILLGPPGSGKGTQSKLLVEKENFYQISTGDILRESVESGSKHGQKLKEIMDRGDLVPDNLVIDMMLNSVDFSKQKKIIFDGFPRNILQAKALESELDKISMKINYVIFLDVSFNILETRIKKRISESDNKNQRTDDNEDTLIKRLEVYKKLTFPIIEFYENKGNLHKIDGMLNVEEVNNKINNIIKSSMLTC